MASPSPQAEAHRERQSLRAVPIKRDIPAGKTWMRKDTYANGGVRLRRVKRGRGKHLDRDAVAQFHAQRRALRGTAGMP
jgi:hypothetical protein